MRLVLDKIDEMQSGNLKLKQFAGDLANTLKSTYENKIRPAVTGGVAGAGVGRASFLDELGLSGLAKSVKQNAEAKETKRQEKEKFVGDFQKYSGAGQNLSADTSRQVAESMFDDLKKMKEELTKLEDEGQQRKEAGYGEDPESKKKQEELIAAIKAIDPRNKDSSASDQSIQQVQGEEKVIEQAEAAAKSLEIQQKESADLTALYTISDDYFKAQTKFNEEVKKLFEQIAENGVGGGGSLLGSAAEMAGDLLGSKKGGAGKVGKAASAAGKLGKFAKIGGGVLAVGTAAYEGYNAYQDAQGAVDRGEITKEEGQVKKGEAVGGGVGGAGGALAGAAAGAAIGSVVPVVGTAIGGIVGGALGYWGGKKAGEAVGGTAVKGYQAVGGNNPSAAAIQNVDAMGNPVGGTGETPPASPNNPNAKLARDWAWSIMTEQAGDKKPSPVIKDQVESIMKNDTQLKQQAEKFLADKKAALQPVPQVTPSMAGAELKAANNQVVNARDAAAAGGGGNTNTVVNAPVTNVSNTNNSGDAKKSSSSRNEDSTYNKYVEKRYYPARAF